jgi:hypothetical protein
MSRPYEQRLHAQRAREDNLGALSRYLATDKTLGENFRSDERVERRRLKNELRWAAEEQEAKEREELAEQHAAHETQRRHHDEQLAAALAAAAADQERQARTASRVCEESAELRSLELKLKAAEMNHQRELQRIEAAELATQQSEQEMRCFFIQSVDPPFPHISGAVFPICQILILFFRRSASWASCPRCSGARCSPT